jgi:predicted dinucleotide-binding enzyme
MSIAIFETGDVGGALAAAATGADPDVVVSATRGWASQSAFRLVGPLTAVAR